MAKIGVLGAGTWGMALARMLSNSGHDVTVWSALPAEVDQLATKRRQKNLPGMVIPDAIKFTKEVAQACEDKDIILFAVPSVFVRSTAKTAAPFIPDGQIIVDVAKGIEPDTLLTLTGVIQDVLTKEERHCLGQRDLLRLGLRRQHAGSLDHPRDGGNQAPGPQDGRQGKLI